MIMIMHHVLDHVPFKRVIYSVNVIWRQHGDWRGDLCIDVVNNTTTK